METFELVRRATNFKLNLGKCAIVPLWAKFCLHHVELVRHRLVASVPDWYRLPVLNQVEFLGTPFGPAVQISDWWRAPLKKFKFRVGQIVASGRCPSLSLSLLSSRATACLQYIAQFHPPPSELHVLEAWAFTKIFRAPGGFFSREMVTLVSSLAKISAKLPSAVCWATFGRAFQSTFARLRPCVEGLANVALSELPFADVRKGAVSPQFWSTPAVAQRFRKPFFSQVDAPPKELIAGEIAWAAASAAARRCEPKIQRFAYTAFIASRFPEPQAWKHVRARFCSVLGHEVSEAVVQKWPRLAKSCRPHTLQCALRTFANGWPDSHRLHSRAEPGPCLFGCPEGRDSLEDHYWSQCPQLFHLVVFAWGSRVSAADLPSSWAALSRLDVVASLFTLYSEVARRHRAGHGVGDLQSAAIAARASHSAR